MRLTKKEEAWLKRFEKTMAAAPSSLCDKVWSYTIGDRDITLVDKVKYDNYFEQNSINEQVDLRDVCNLVSDSGSALCTVISLSQLKVRQVSMSHFGECTCGGSLHPVWFEEEEAKIVQGHMIRTGRYRRAVDHLTCLVCLSNYCVDDTFDGTWYRK